MQTVSGSGTSQLIGFSSATTLAVAAPTLKHRKRHDQGYEVYEVIEDIECECDGVGPHTETSFSTSYFAAPTSAAPASSSPASEECSSGVATTTVTTTMSPAAPGASTTTV